MMRQAFAAVLPILLVACGTIAVSDSDVFRGSPSSQKVDPSGQRLAGEEKLTQSVLRPSTSNAIEARLVARLPAVVTHEVETLGGETIAISRIRSSKADANEPLIVSCGGQSFERLKSGVSYAQKVLPWGEVLLFDYPGFGGSSGTSDRKTISAVERDLAVLADRLAGDRPLVFWGHSLGGFVCAELAAMSATADGVVLETTAATVQEIAQAKVPWFMPFLKVEVGSGLEAFDTPKALSRFRGPILVLGAGKDSVIPVSLERALADKLKAAGLNGQYHEFANSDHDQTAINSGFAGVGENYFRLVSGS